MKSYTDLEQSKKLAKILPLQTADMYYINSNTITIGKWEDDTHDEDDLPCWSLAALLRLMPNFSMFKRTIECRIETTNHLIDKVCEPIDAAFEMVCWLKENGKI